MSDTSILWSYPFVFRRVRRVDAKYAYLVVKDGYVPLRRREGVLRAFLPYEKYGRFTVSSAGYDFTNKVIENIDELCSFFQTQMEEEYMLEEKYDVSEYGKLWDNMFEEKYGMNEKEEYLSTVKFEEEYDVRKKLKDEREKLESLYNHS